VKLQLTIQYAVRCKLRTKNRDIHPFYGNNINVPMFTPNRTFLVRFGRLSGELGIAMVRISVDKRSRANNSHEKAKLGAWYATGAYQKGTIRYLPSKFGQVTMISSSYQVSDLISHDIYQDSTRGFNYHHSLSAIITHRNREQIN